MARSEALMIDFLGHARQGAAGRARRMASPRRAAMPTIENGQRSMRLLPRKTTFFDLFDQHAALLVSIAQELREMVHSFDRLQERQARIKELEHQCDKITHQI